MNVLETKFAGLTLRNPLIIGSSGLTHSAVGNLRLEEAGAGAVILKSLFEEQIELQSDSLMQSSDAPEAADYIRNYVRANQIEEYLTLIRDTKAKCSIPVIASINCYKSSVWTEFASQIEQAGADAIELNVFYFQNSLDIAADKTYDLYISILKQVRRQVKIPVIIKTGKFFSNITGLVNQLQRNGADGVTLFNRYYRPDIDIEKMSITSGETLSLPSEIGDTLRWTAIVSGFVPEISIASSTGIHTYQDAVKCLLAGASAIQLCSTVYKNGNEVIALILEGIKGWMDSKKFRTVSDFRGKMSYSNASDPSLYERAQFMRYFSAAKP
ncbi:MAG: dihydroorotate dehydrogenase-like protein [Tannerella sp.]|jgi:dihydroorotate dehydrogenase (fumarate)|nr:dihydroorotate dehydrogenase-like protein [Tannerella sp.]